jgi:hypothetical protein
VAKSMYKEHREEILEMKANGVPDPEIVVHLNNKYNSGATLNALRVFFTRDAEEQKQKQEEKNAETLPQKQEVPKIELEKLLPGNTNNELENKKDVEEEVKARLLVNELNFIKEKHQEGIDIFSILNKELGTATEKLRKRAEQKDSRFLLAGIWLLTILFAIFTGYYLGRCFPRITFLYIMHSISIPGGAFIGLAIGLAIMYKKLNEEKE